jgi:hypothetical protein
MRGRVDEYEIIADGLSQQVQVGLAGGVAALYPGHFALEDKAAEIAARMRDFLARTVPPT